MKADPTLLSMKYADVVEALVDSLEISRDEALGLFYHSKTYELMRESISDMHCMSVLYLVEELAEELADRRKAQ